ncbi:MAG: hypothetical protein LBE32_03790 [Burkholderiales bacterium]|jgi:hypothetical protein|nr:hypothetical protein [Burkholderiales bacterium]
MNEETRLALWEAFSTFFLDTEITDANFRLAANVIKESGISLDEAEAVLWNEVFPALRQNLMSVAGNWTGFSREWLKANLRPSTGPAKRPLVFRAGVRAIQNCWESVLPHLKALEEEWRFDQGPNVAAITTRQVLDDGLPILQVVHYDDDDSWAFTCGTTDDPGDGRVISMRQALDLDSTLAQIADLPSGWRARRDAVGGVWRREKND